MCVLRKDALVVGPWRYSAGLNISGCDDVDSSAGGVAEVAHLFPPKRGEHKD